MNHIEVLHPPAKQRCRAMIFAGYGTPERQCSRRGGYGPDGALCKQHNSPLKYWKNR